MIKNIENHIFYYTDQEKNKCKRIINSINVNNFKNYKINNNEISLKLNLKDITKKYFEEFDQEKETEKENENDKYNNIILITEDMNKNKIQNKNYYYNNDNDKHDTLRNFHEFDNQNFKIKNEIKSSNDNDLFIDIEKLQLNNNNKINEENNIFYETNANKFDENNNINIKINNQINNNNYIIKNEEQNNFLFHKTQSKSKSTSDFNNIINSINPYSIPNYFPNQNYNPNGNENIIPSSSFGINKVQSNIYPKNNPIKLIESTRKNNFIDNQSNKSIINNNNDNNNYNESKERKTEFRRFEKNIILPKYINNNQSLVIDTRNLKNNRSIRNSSFNSGVNNRYDNTSNIKSQKKILGCSIDKIMQIGIEETKDELNELINIEEKKKFENLKYENKRAKFNLSKNGLNNIENYNIQKPKYNFSPEKNGNDIIGEDIGTKIYKGNMDNNKDNKNHKDKIGNSDSNDCLIF
jgi:hypothetical protein